MKNAGMLVMLVCMLIAGCHALQTGKSTGWIKPGTQMTYDVNQDGRQYRFIVSLKTIGPEIAFDWRMTEPANSAGDVTITAEALDQAIGQHNYFVDGSLYLDEKTTVWLSHKVFGELSDSGKTTIDLGGIGGGEQTLSLLEQTDMTVPLNGTPKQLPILSAKTDKGHTFRILNDPKHPIILAMSVGFDVSLSQITCP